MQIHARQIIKDIDATPRLNDAIVMIVQKVQASMSSDASAFYLRNAQTDDYVLMAADGADVDAIGKRRIKKQEGLVGWIAEHEEAVNLADAADHPGFHPNVEPRGEFFHGFLGAPIIHYRRVLGILVVRKIERQKFDDDETAFFITLAAQLGSVINNLLLKWDVSRHLTGPSHGRMIVQGISCAPGITTGVITPAHPTDLQSTPDHQVRDIDAEERAFRTAVIAAKQELRSSRNRMSGELPAEVLSVFDVYELMLESEKLNSKTIARIRAGQLAQGAVSETILELAQVFERMTDTYIAAKAEDIRNVGRHILGHLQGAVPAPGMYPEHCILAGTELSLVDVLNVPRHLLAAIICRNGSALSHIAILARALGIPAVIGLTDLPLGYLSGCTTVVDGNRGIVCINPSPEDLLDFNQRLSEEQAASAQLDTLRHMPAETKDGVLMPLYVNLGISADDVLTGDEKNEGVGLYRTEFFFISRNTLPTEDEQYRLYRSVLENYAPLPVNIRTLDTGADKALPFFSISEANPFLGLRGIRFTLDHPEIFLTQLRALLRANAGLDNLKIIFPMISKVSEIDDTLSLIERAHHELLAEGQVVTKPLLGAMIEVPSAVYSIGALSDRLDFFSIGTNDLTQYLLAVDRNNPNVQDFYDNLHPAVIHVVHDIITRAHSRMKPVGVCGEMAGNPAAALLLLGMGADSLSMDPSYLPRVKWTIHNFTMKQAQELSKAALQVENETGIAELLDNALSEAGLGILVR